MKLNAQQTYVLLLTLGAGVVATGAAFLWRRKPKDPAEAERRRRLRLSQMGRIVEGHILEIEEEGEITADPLRVAPAVVRAPASAISKHGRHRVVFYRYSISGVTYETAQDLIGLDEKFAMDALVAGQPVSVKFDPANPSNSILMSDDWSGLH